MPLESNMTLLNNQITHSEMRAGCYIYKYKIQKRFQLQNAKNFDKQSIQQKSDKSYSIFFLFV